MKCLIVDDELLARDLLKEYIAKIERLELVKVCIDAVEAMNYLQNNPVDIIFLDINMPELNGIDFLKTLQNSPKIILTTAYSEYALEGYEFGVIDYLLKPIAFHRFLKAVNRVLELGSNIPKETNNTQQEKEVLVIKEEGIPHKIPFLNILYIKSFGNYLKVITDEKTFIMLGTISGIEKDLSQQFQRVHRSYIVNVKEIEKLKAKVLEIRKNEIPVSAMYRLQLQEKMDNI